MGLAVYEGDWWCARCSATITGPVDREYEPVPHCTRCGTVLELAGTGDDDPYPDDPDWRDT
jgi:hypothetical protein